MSDVTDAILAWRRELQLSGGVSADEMAELESHLVQEIESLEKSGLRADEVFVIASRRLGHPFELAAEYSKNHSLMSWRRPARLALWGALALQAMTLCWSAILVALNDFDLWILMSGPWLRNASYIAQWSTLGFLWWLAENPNGSVARSLAWAEEGLRSTRGALCLAVGTIVCFVLGTVSLRLLLQSLLNRQRIQTGVPQPFDIISLDMITQLVLGQLAWILPVVVLLVILVRAEQRPSIAKLAMH